MPPFLLAGTLKPHLEPSHSGHRHGLERDQEHQDEHAQSRGQVLRRVDGLDAGRTGTRAFVQGHGIILAEPRRLQSTRGIGGYPPSACSEKALRNPAVTSSPV